MTDEEAKKALEEDLPKVSQFSPKLASAYKVAISALSENKGEWIPFSKELPPKDKKVHVSTFGIVTIGERTSEANEALRLSILEPMNNLYKNIDPKQYQITHWQPLPKGYER